MLSRSTRCKNIRLNLKLGVAILLGVSATAQDIVLNVTYVCNGERVYVESCNMRGIPTAPPTASWPTPTRPAAH